MITESELKAVRMALSRIHGFNASKEHVFNRIAPAVINRVEARGFRKPLGSLLDVKS